MNISLNQAMTIGAVGLAVYALYVVTRSNVNGNAAKQPGQTQRDAELATWASIVEMQASMSPTMSSYYMPNLTRTLQ